MRDPKQALENFRETPNELFHDDPWIDSHLDPIVSALEERDALRTLLSEWLRERRFMVASTPEMDDLVERTRTMTELLTSLKGE